MSKISSYNIAEAIYESSINKTDVELESIYKRSIDTISRLGMLSKSDQILQRLQKIIDQKDNTLRIKVTSSINLTDKQKEEIEQFIKERKKVENVYIENIINEKVIGGFKIEVGDEIIDTTLSYQLEKLKIHLNK